MTRRPVCHPGREHRAHELCGSCYVRWWLGGCVWEDGRPAVPPTVTELRAARVEDFKRLRVKDHARVEQAGRALGVGPRAAWRMEAERLAELGPATVAERRAARLERFTEARARGLRVELAGREVGLQARQSWRYESRRVARLSSCPTADAI